MRSFVAAISRPLAVLVCALLCAVAIPPSAALAGDATEARQQQAQANATFALELYRQLASEEGENKNLFVSPLSISTALAMTYAGARGNTAQQMRDTLHLELEGDALHEAFAHIAASVQPEADDTPYQIAIANRLWGEKTLAFEDAFLKQLKSVYGAGLAQVDFKSDYEGARKQINAWVADATQGLIEELIGAGVLDDSTRLVLTNAIYFKGSWSLEFDESATRDEDFFVSESKTVTAPLMHQTSKFPYGTLSSGVQMIALPYEGDRLSMVVLLPERGELEALEAALEGEALLSKIRGLTSTKVELTLPRFETAYDVRLDTVLKQLGMPLPFSDAADFSGMTQEAALAIDAVIHKAFVEVNEEGTEAAAATAVVTGVRGRSVDVPQEPVVFRADHPFVFLIHDRETDSILFLGRVIDPTR